MKKSDKQQITYIKLPVHEINYMTHIHGCPMVFSELSPYTTILRNFIVSNPQNRFKHTALSFTETAVRIATAAQKANQMDMFTLDANIPSLDILPQLVPVVIPDEKIVTDAGKLKCERTNGTYQLTKQGVELFRAQSKTEFWTALTSWINKGKMENAKLLGYESNCSTKDLIIQFMTYYNIPIEQFENIYRQLNRAKNKLGS